MDLRNYKREIISAILGASLAGLASLGVGMYSLTKSFEYTQNREILYSVRKDVEYLMRIESEIDRNINSLLQTNYLVSIEFGKPIDMVELMSEDEKEMTPDKRELLGQMVGSVVPVLKFEAPRELLVIDVWETGFPETSNIEFDLLNQINDYYQSIRRVNKTVEQLMSISQGIAVKKGFSEVLTVHIKKHNEVVQRLKSQNFVALKNKIIKEKVRLTKIRNKLLGDVATFSTVKNQSEF